MSDIKLFTAEHLDNKTGFTWTVVSRVGDMIKKAESLFGDRDKSYTLLGVEVGANDYPQIWYPGGHSHVIIQISHAAASNMNLACFQLSHEVIHLLSPSGAAAASNLEEGVAVYFSDYYMKRVMNDNTDYLRGADGKYKKAFEVVRQVLDDPMYKYFIKDLRVHTPSFSKITTDHLIPVFSKSDANFLVKKFSL